MGWASWVRTTWGQFCAPTAAAAATVFNSWMGPGAGVFASAGVGVLGIAIDRITGHFEEKEILKQARENAGVAIRHELDETHEGSVKSSHEAEDARAQAFIATPNASTDEVNIEPREREQGAARLPSSSIEAGYEARLAGVRARREDLVMQVTLADANGISLKDRAELLGKMAAVSTDESNLLAEYQQVLERRERESDAPSPQVEDGGAQAAVAGDRALAPGTPVDTAAGTPSSQPAQAGTGEEPQVQEPQVQEPQVQEPQVQEPQVQEPQVQEPQVQEPQVQESQVQESQAQNPEVQPGASTPQLSPMDDDPVAAMRRQAARQQAQRNLQQLGVEDPAKAGAEQLQGKEGVEYMRTRAAIEQGLKDKHQVAAGTRPEHVTPRTEPTRDDGSKDVA